MFYGVELVKIKIVFFVLFFIVFLDARNDFQKLYKGELSLKQEKFLIWVALNPKQHKEGLSGIKSLGEKEGMLFSYPFPKTLSFWMKGTLIDLDIAFIKRDGTVVDIYYMKKEEKKIYSSSQKVALALELNAGRFKKLGLKVGDKIVIPKDIQDLF